jgi:hypothetical protein
VELGIVLFLIGGGITLVFTILRGRNLFFNRGIRGVVIRLLFPLLVMVGDDDPALLEPCRDLCPQEEERIEAAFKYLLSDPDYRLDPFSRLFTF